MENSLVLSLSGRDSQTGGDAGDFAPSSRATPYRRSYVNDAVEVLRIMGRSMKLQELQAQIKEKRGKDVSLGSLKVCLSRYVDTTDSTKLLTRIAPGLFALSEWDNVWTSRLGQSPQTHSGRSRPNHYGPLAQAQDFSDLALFRWTLPANPQLKLEEQRVYIRAVDEESAILSLERAGVEAADQGLVEKVDNGMPNTLAEAHVQ